MYSKEQIHELRDTLIKEQNSKPHSFIPGGKTASYILDNIMYESDADTIEHTMKALLRPDIPFSHLPDYEIDYKLAYNLLFGDISTAPLHINDALESVAKWRLRQPQKETGQSLDQPVPVR